ncbi:hypothetical protein G0U57_018030 [Chelydra serpentina]|uniref:VWFD domain-containing protein n=1 Tax=Chelydra serpentina TaxID=8475 RepID=A0A8T1S5Y1_CHESE|nr:hypothetical protein G0U57_018030 [Chelydra serpentina]
MAWHFPTTVSVQLKGAVTFRGVKYAAGSRLTVFLLAFEAAQFQSREDLSGSRIVSWKSVAVLSGHSCTSKHSSCDHVVEQLLPVSSWGTTFIIPPLSFQPKYDLVYIVASQRSHLSYHWGREISRKDMVAGEVVTLETTRSKPLYITSSAGIQVVFFCTGRSKEGFTYDPFIINIPPITSYCRSYHLDGIKGFQNYALIIAKSSEADGITTSGQLLSNVQWKPIQGTDFSWAEYDLGEGVGSHSLESPNSAFGVLSVGISTEFAGYGSQALCRCDSPHSCSTIECRKKERCEITNCSPACVAESEATCQVQGESQYHTFDGQAFSFAGTCTYAIARTCGLDPALPSFSVEAKNQNPRNTRVSSVGLCESSHLGREFITAFMQNSGKGKDPDFQLLITGYSATTLVTVTVHNSTFRRKITVEQGQTVTVHLPPSVEMVGSGTFNSTVLVCADKDITVLSLSYKQYTSETTVVFPVESMGNSPHSCSTIECRKKERCEITNCSPACVAESEATCQVQGESQYHTFDGQAFSFAGTCTYAIARTCGLDPALPSFSVEAKNQNPRNTRVSSVAFVTVRVYNVTISMDRYAKGLVQVNAQSSSLPVSLMEGKLRVYQRGGSVVVETDFSLRVSYDWSSLVVKISSSFWERVCGLCGNYNGDPGDDFATPAGALAASPVEFGRSWKVEDGDRFCWDDCHGECKSCSPEVVGRYKAEPICGWITKEAGGPFSQCHSVVDPKIYLDNCVYDLCMNDGLQDMLCQALASYADACRGEGVDVSDWRTPAGCPLPCPENSQYQLCGSACPATCNDPAAPHNCSSPCVETCQCNEGFVLDAGKCIRKAGCGCEFQGHLYAPGEPFWGDSACTRRCVCDPQSRQASCEAAGCRAGEQCRVKKGFPNCYPTSYASCTASGDPHYTSFDGHRFDFQGSCQYQLAGQCQEQEELVDFQVLVQNDNRGLRAVSFTRAVEVRVYGVNITVSRDYPGRVLVNGVLINLPYSTDDSKISMYRRGQDAAIQTDFHLTIAFDWQGRVTLTAPSTYAGALCGLCGNFNGDKGDELIMKDGNVAPNATAFGQSWRVAETPGCAEPEKQECSNLAAVNRHQRKIQGECGMILATAGPFRECQRKVPPEGYFQDCIYDYCFFRGHQAVVCQIVASYAAACQAAGVTIEPWRSNSFCDPTCPRNSHYELCGSGCPATCHGLSAPDGCDDPCAEGCFCDPGFLLSGDRCVSIEQCGCVHQGRYYRKGEEFYASASCRERCRCQDNGVVECQEASCGASEECRVESGVLGCYPAGRCTVAGDSHYLSFDGRAFDLHGNCTYTLARVCSSDAGLVNFSVVVGKENAAGGRVARMRAVVVSVHGYTITMERGRKWKVGGELYNLPLAMDEGKLLINQEGNNIIVQSASGLQVLYDAASYLLVSVPSTYKGHVCGLCGNFNGDKNDDFLLPSGTSAQDAEEFGASWKVPVDGATCSEGCNDRCPICGANQTAPYRTERSCGLIRATSGPFRDCHSLVNPAEYFNHCLYDMCATNGTGETLCQSLQGYTAACQTAGAKIRAWRTASFCPLPCPANSHYELCTRSCDFTCAGLSSSPQCTERCFEGCQCDNRLLFDGDSCVFPGGCGCFQYGRYIKVGDW